MGLFEKKEKIPDIPELPKLPELPKESESHMLPSLPSIGENLNREIVKSAVDEYEPKDNFRGIPGKADLPDTERKRTLEISGTEKMTKQAEPVFIRIDKFQSAQKNFNDVKNKIKSAEAVLRKIDEVKLKENAEISSLTGELEKIKARLKEIDANVFSRI